MSTASWDCNCVKVGVETTGAVAIGVTTVTAGTDCTLGAELDPPPPPPVPPPEHGYVVAETVEV
jgi:hypothetical protein